MQVITMYLRATSVKATLVDEWNQPVSVLPALTRGLRAELVLKLLEENGESVSEEKLSYASWDFAIANDWDTSTTPQLRVTEGISVKGNEIHIPLTETNTEELIDALGKSEQATFGCELAGFTTGETSPEFLIQFDIIVRNRRADAGTGRPEPVGDGSYTAAQIRALFAAKMLVQLSDDGKTWYAADPTGPLPESARWYRIRNELAGLNWSEPIPLLTGPRGERSTIRVGTVTAGAVGSAPQVTNSGDAHDAVFNFTLPTGMTGPGATIQVGKVETLNPGEPAQIKNTGTSTAAVFDFKVPQGPQGEKGDGSYLYVAYAEKSDGTGFSLVPSSTLKYRAEILVDTPIEHPTLANFQSAKWVKFSGDDATVFGDVLVADMDTSIAKVSRIIFENARIRKGIDGEVIVNFKEAGVTNDELSHYAIVNGRTRLSSWTNGGGSPSAMLGQTVFRVGDIPQWVQIEIYSTFIG